jgi:hypothetical protein
VSTAPSGRLTEDGSSNNSLGIRAKVASDGSRFYTVPEAGHLVGRDPSNRYRDKVDLTGPDGKVRAYLPADPLERERADLLQKLGVADVAPADVREVQQLRERLATLQSQVRQIVASRSLVSDGLQNLLKGGAGATRRNTHVNTNGRVGVAR